MNVFCVFKGFVIGLCVWLSVCEYFGATEGSTVDCNVTFGELDFWVLAL